MAGLTKANSSNLIKIGEQPVVTLIDNQDAEDDTEVRTDESDLGGTMRLGAQ